MRFHHEEPEEHEGISLDRMDRIFRMIPMRGVRMKTERRTDDSLSHSQTGLQMAR